MISGWAFLNAAAASSLSPVAIAVLSGPNIAAEIARCLPATAVIGAESPGTSFALPLKSNENRDDAPASPLNW